LGFGLEALRKREEWFRKKKAPIPQSVERKILVQNAHKSSPDFNLPSLQIVSIKLQPLMVSTKLYDVLPEPYDLHICLSELLLSLAVLWCRIKIRRLAWIEDLG
jgi:hypothetical protein